MPLLGIFEKKMRLEVPIFQRLYTWNREVQWEPLWEDVARKFVDQLEGREDAPAHFLGAMVLDQKQTPTTHVERRQVIDGQQRLTTMQIFLAAFRDFCRAQGAVELANELGGFTLNRGMMADQKVEKFKLWPTKLDQPQFVDVIEAGSRAALEAKHPLIKLKYHRKPKPRPLMVEAYLFFYDQFGEFFLGSNGEEPVKAEVALPTRLESCFQAMKNTLKVVAIDLEADDEPQVIFETLNARGAPLLPADLIRNFVFFRAGKSERQQELYDRYWRFEDSFWSVEVTQGRLSRPRSDLFLQHYLASRQGREILVKHLFAEYKIWVTKTRPFKSVEEELATLARQGDHYKAFLQPKPTDPFHSLASFLEVFDIGTSYPLVLALMEVKLDAHQWKRVSDALESYLLRRAICGWTTKNYNQIFLKLTRELHEVGFTPENLSQKLTELQGESVEWPSDAALKEAWLNKPVYQTLNNPKLVHVLLRLNQTYLGKKMEEIAITNPLSVEHIMARDWLEFWPLAGGGTGLSDEELFEADEADPTAIATRDRNARIHTLGNLTILTQPLNSSLSKSAWGVKKPELLKHSLLPINQQLQSKERWDEDEIAERGNELFEKALRLWPHP